MTGNPYHDLILAIAKLKAMAEQIRIENLEKERNKHGRKYRYDFDRPKLIQHEHGGLAACH